MFVYYFEWENYACKEKNGAALICDEEGFNNITLSNKFTFLNRLDREAARYIDAYACWGQIDYEFWAKVPELNSKLKIIGNCRSDLLGALAKDFYSDQIFGLKSLFGDYVLISDNFSVERRGNSTVFPKYNVTLDEANAAELELEKRNNNAARRRAFFADCIYETADNMPHTNFIIRPHPCADHQWWTSRFASLRNVHIIYHLNIDPWILSARCLISIGCSSAIQSVIAKTPVIEIIDPLAEEDNGQNQGYAHLFSNLSSKNASDLIATISNLDTSHLTSFTNVSLLQKYWFNCKSDSTYKNYAKVLFELSEKVKAHSPLDLYEVLKAVSIHFKNPALLPIDDTKWIKHSLKSEILKIQKLSRIFGNKNISMNKKQKAFT